jgi:4-hydroxybenzoate polyprenyltransferase
MPNDGCGHAVVIVSEVIADLLFVTAIILSLSGYWQAAIPSFLIAAYLMISIYIARRIWSSNDTSK